MVEMFLFFLLFYNALILNNQKILWLPSIFQFERTVTDLNHPRPPRQATPRQAKPRQAQAQAAQAQAGHAQAGHAQADNA